MGRSVPLRKLDLAPRLNVLISKEPNIKSVRFFISRRATCSSRQWNAFSHNRNLFQGRSSKGLIWYSAPFQNCQTTCSLRICCYFFFSLSLKSYKPSQKIEWSLWGREGQAEAAEVKGKALRKDWSHFVCIVFDFVLKRLLNWSREVWLLSLFGLLLSP